MKIYAKEFDPNTDDRFATELDQFAGEDIWVQVKNNRFGMTEYVWVRPIEKKYIDGNVYWVFNKINNIGDYDAIPNFMYDSKRQHKQIYNFLHVVEPLNVLSTEDLMEECGLYNKDKETEDFLDNIIGQDVWAHVSAVIPLQGREYYTTLYVKVLDKQDDEYTYNSVYDGDVDDPDMQYMDYTRSGVKDMMSAEHTLPAKKFGLLDDTTYTTAEIEKALDKPWLED